MAPRLAACASKSRVLIRLSLTVNVVVLIPVVAGLFADADRATVVFGMRSPARDILACIYTAILVVSLALLLATHIEATHEVAAIMALGLFMVQIFYKLLTPIMVIGGKPHGLPFNPVVLSNVGIAALHSVTLFVSLKARHERGIRSQAVVVAHPSDT
mmetsp:Transcript_127463/g.366642  ORF Transcript_127463/g.366642 Transcript_127463/m.366642 type:complete len:158 (-) Transcript_127463:241-714(-)